MPKKHLLFAITLISLFVASRYLVPQPVEFDSLDECKRCLESRGFYCMILDRGKAMVISEATFTKEEAVDFQIKHALKVHTGKVFATVFLYHYDQDGRTLRTLGHVAFTGDPAILDKIAK